MKDDIITFRRKTTGKYSFNGRISRTNIKGIITYIGYNSYKINSNDISGTFDIDEKLLTGEIFLTEQKFSPHDPIELKRQ